MVLQNITKPTVMEWGTALEAMAAVFDMEKAVRSKWKKTRRKEKRHWKRWKRNRWRMWRNIYRGKNAGGGGGKVVGEGAKYEEENGGADCNTMLGNPMSDDSGDPGRHQGRLPPCRLHPGELLEETGQPPNDVTNHSRTLIYPNIAIILPTSIVLIIIPR